METSNSNQLTDYAKNMPSGYGICPVCNGTAQVELDESDRKYRWNDGRTHRPCRNCGGQTMSLRGSGIVLLRKDNNEPCLHEYKYTKLGNCYHGYNCKHCGHSYQIDSGD